MSIIRYIGSQFANPQGMGGTFSTYFMNTLNQSQYRCIRRIFDKVNPQTVLDIGFGNGYLIRTLSKNSKSRFYGIEKSTDMVAKGRKRNELDIEAGITELCYGDVMELPFEDAGFDFIYTVNTVYFWPDLKTGYEEIYRTMKRGAVSANVFYAKGWLDKLQYTNYGFSKYEPQELYEQVCQMGFSKVRLVEIKKQKAYCILAWKESDR